MNFLAHLHLSGNNAHIKIGNFIADAVKGNNYLQYNPQIRTGILLHRKIDYFTDRHPITKKINVFFNSKYRKHSGIVTDIIYDYYLANAWEHYSSENFEQYIANTYNLLMQNFGILPLRIKKMLPFFIGRNRLMSYRKMEGIKSVLTAMSKYTSLPYAPDFAIEIMKQNHKYFNEQFYLFYDELLNFTKKELDKNYHHLLEKK